MEIREQLIKLVGKCINLNPNVGYVTLNKYFRGKLFYDKEIDLFYVANKKEKKVLDIKQVEKIGEFTIRLKGEIGSGGAKIIKSKYKFISCIQRSNQKIYTYSSTDLPGVLIVVEQPNVGYRWYFTPDSKNIRLFKSGYAYIKEVETIEKLMEKFNLT
jgi:hypothetical protein